jgi:DNA-binding transcriptional MerR regulator
VNNRSLPDPGLGVYGISVAADLVGMAPQTLRLYEDRGLLDPARTAGGTRRYSQDDLDRLRRISELLGDGLNLAGVAAVLGLESDNVQLRRCGTGHPRQHRSTVSSPHTLEGPWLASIPNRVYGIPTSPRPRRTSTTCTPP